MLKTKKKAVIAVVMLLLIFTFAGQSLAVGYETNDGFAIITPQWVNTDQVVTSLAFESSKSICSAFVIAKAGTSQITGTVILDRLNPSGTYTTVKTWNSLIAYGNYLEFNETYYVSTGYTYRLTLTTIVYRNGTSETISTSTSAYAG